MSNPYEGFDAIDPWDDTDDLDSSGNFEYVEDAYAPLVEDGTDGLGSLDAQPLPMSAPAPATRGPNAVRLTIAAVPGAGLPLPTCPTLY